MRHLVDKRGEGTINDPTPPSPRGTVSAVSRELEMPVFTRFRKICRAYRNMLYHKWIEFRPIVGRIW